MLKAVETRGRAEQIFSTQGGSKLFKLIEWEILLVNVMQFLHQWPQFGNSGLEMFYLPHYFSNIIMFTVFVYFSPSFLYYFKRL